MGILAVLIVVGAVARDTQLPTTHLSGTVIATWSGEPRAGAGRGRADWP